MFEYTVSPTIFKGMHGEQATNVWCAAKSQRTQPTGNRYASGYRASPDRVDT